MRLSSFIHDYNENFKFARENSFQETDTQLFFLPLLKDRIPLNPLSLTILL